MQGREKTANTFACKELCEDHRCNTQALGWLLRKAKSECFSNTEAVSVQPGPKASLYYVIRSCAGLTDCLITLVWLLLFSPFHLLQPGIMTLIVPGCFLNIHVFPLTGNITWCSRLPSGTGKEIFCKRVSASETHRGPLSPDPSHTLCPPPLNA